MKSSLKQDIIPVTDLMHNAAEIIKKIQKTQRPILVTQNGRAVMICMDVEEYEQQMKRLNLIDAILSGERAFAAGQFSAWDDFEKELDKM